MTCCSWNVKSGLIRRELEIRNLIENENIDVLFLNETDSNQLQTESDFTITGVNTIFQKREDNCEKVRLICLVKESLMTNFTVRQDLMSTDFPSIWLEVNETNKQTVLLSGFYCEWNHKGNKSEASQVKCFEEFSNQI